MILFIHRKDLRIQDMPAFEYITQREVPSLHTFIVDPAIIGQGRHVEHSGIQFLRTLSKLVELYKHDGLTLHLLYGDPIEITHDLVQRYPVQEIVVHEDYTPYSRERDGKLERVAAQRNISFTSLPDQPLIDWEDFHRFAERTDAYKVFTPFYRKWKAYMDLFFQPPVFTDVNELQTVALDSEVLDKYSLPFLIPNSSIDEPSVRLQDFIEDDLDSYERYRDYYSEEGTSHLSSALNTGAISSREVYAAVLHLPQAESWRRQLAWRDFYLYQSHQDPVFYSYENRFDLSALNDFHFEAWSQGNTGIPVIDAAMRQLNQTGYLPNRLRMITAMFLTKNLLCPFSLGEAYFRIKLADYDHALNRGGWLWCSSLGYDASPYFRIMNPVTQSQKFDPHGRYLRDWLPELAHLEGKALHQPHPQAIVDLKGSRLQAIEVYRGILQTSKSQPLTDNSFPRHHQVK